MFMRTTPKNMKKIPAKGEEVVILELRLWNKEPMHKLPKCKME